jgi:hypothetical protein
MTARHLDYVTHPTLPTILNCSTSCREGAKHYPRQDLVIVFPLVFRTEQLGWRNASFEYIDASGPAVQQNNLGVIGGDTAGFPNGRRPGDDVVDIALRVVMGKPDRSRGAFGQLAFTDGALVNASFFAEKFPYLRRRPVYNEPSVQVTVNRRECGSLSERGRGL